MVESKQDYVACTLAKHQRLAGDVGWWSAGEGGGRSPAWAVLKDGASGVWWVPLPLTAHVALSHHQPVHHPCTCIHHPSQCRGCQGANPLQRCHQAHSTWMRTQPTTHRPQPRPTGGWLSLIHTNGNVLAPDGQAWHPDGTCWALMAPDGRPTAIMGDPQQCWEVHSGPSRPTRPGMGPIQIRWATAPVQAGRDGPKLQSMGT